MQCKLTVGRVDDPLEYEADRVADQVMRMPDSAPAMRSAPEAAAIQRAPSIQDADAIQRKCAACEEEEEGPGAHKVHTKRSSSGQKPGAFQAPSIVDGVVKQPGSPLDRPTRQFFESRFGTSFDSVRIHTDGQAAESARSVAARAYTVGNHVAFGAGEFSPNSHAGRTLLAHELVHVQQQRGGDSGVLARVPTRAGVEKEDYSFSTNCGWIDWGHANPGFAKKLIASVQAASDALAPGATPAADAGTTTSPAMQASKAGVVFSSASMTVKLARTLTPDEVIAVSLSLFKNISIIFEVQQIWTDWASGSAFSQEDLPSNLISFYRAAKGYSQGDIKGFCASQGKDASLQEFDARHDFKKNKTFDPIGATGPWPAELSSIDEKVGGSLYTVQSSTVGGPANRSAICPMYRVVGTIGDTDLFIISVGGAHFTAADNVRVVPTYQVDPDRTGGGGSFTYIEVTPFAQPDIDAFNKKGVKFPVWAPSNVLECLELSGTDVAATLRRMPVANGAANTGAAPPSVSETLGRPGSSLSAEARAFMEPRFGENFGGVRVHTDDAAARSAEAIGARAYTLGNHIVFGRGHEPSGSSMSRRLLAHELSHVVQQRGARRPNTAPAEMLVRRDTDPAAPAPAAPAAPAVPINDQIAKDVFGVADYDTYVASLKSTTFFGQSIDNVHDQLIQMLGVAEADLKKTQPATYKPKKADSTLRKGVNGMHGWGMAVDFDVMENPYVLNESGDAKLDPELVVAYNHIAQFILGKAKSSLTNLKKGRSAFGAGTAGDVYDELNEESNAMKRYFALKDDAAKLNDFLANEWDAKHPGEAAPDASIVQQQMEEDYVALGGKGLDGKKKSTGGNGDRPFAPKSSGGAGDPATGFLNLDKPFVMAMTDAGFAWGAIDIAGAPGDIQHFDTRLKGTGAKLFGTMMKLKAQAAAAAKPAAAKKP